MRISRRRNLYGFETREFDHRRTPQPKPDIKALWQRNHEILRLALLGHKQGDIAKQLGIAATTVSHTLNSQLGMEKLSAMRAERDAESIEVAKEVQKLFPQALAVYEEILNDDSGEADLALKMKAANHVLMDLGGHRSPTKVQTQVAHAHLTLEDIDELKKRGLEAARAAGLLVEVALPAEISTSDESDYDSAEDCVDAILCE